MGPCRLPGLAAGTAAVGVAPDEPLQHLRWVRDRGAKHDTDYQMARAELVRMKSAPAAAR
jgi:hypothetical protein